MWLGEQHQFWGYPGKLGLLRQKWGDGLYPGAYVDWREELLGYGGGGGVGKDRKSVQGRWPSRAAWVQREVERGCDSWPEHLASPSGASKKLGRGGGC